MADVMPNYLVEQQRLRASIASQQNTIQNQVLAILEMADRKARHLENIAAARRQIEEMQVKLRELEQTHGTLNDQTIDDMIKSLEVKHG